jgi:hypothetical protein
MAYQKRSTSESFDKLSFRLEAMRTINPAFDLGNGLDVDKIDGLIDDLRSYLHEYNDTLSDADDLRTTLISLEKKANDAAQRLLSAVLVKFGQDSYEYRRVGGTRKSEILPTGSRPLTFQPATENGSGSDGSTGASGEGTTP